jgi:DNA-binding response OmpR family regulator
MRILVVEDEFNLADVIKSKLEKEKYVVDISTDGEDGLYNALMDIYDLIILDVMLPKIDGFEILREIRKKGISSKVIMLTAKSTLGDKLKGFEKGANDYITKPFHIDELLARVNAQLKISIGTDKEDVLTYGDLSLDLGTSELTCTKTNDSVGLVCKEFQIISYLMNNPNRILSKEQIYDKVWGIDNDIESNNLEAYLSFARKKLKAIGSDVYIKASRGMGYKMGYEDE